MKSAIAAVAMLMVPVCAAAQEIPRFPLTIGAESPELFFVQR
jgi:hypothetical protein